MRLPCRSRVNHSLVYWYIVTLADPQVAEVLEFERPEIERTAQVHKLQFARTSGYTNPLSHRLISDEEPARAITDFAVGISR